MERHFDKHIDNQELSALVPWPAGSGQEAPGLSAEAVGEAERHVQSCADCAYKVARYRLFVDQLSDAAVAGAAPPGPGCPRDVDWFEVAAGLWPELKARQLIMHAALCDHCGPLLRASTSVDQEPTPQEERLLAQLAAPKRPALAPRPAVPSPPRWPLMRWLVPVTLVLMVTALVSLTSRGPLSGTKFAESAVATYKQLALEDHALDFRSDSQQALNEWLQAKSPFALALPASVPVPGEDRPYRLQGARLVQVSGKPAVYISYQMQSGPVGLVVTPDSVAAASGGVEADFKKVTFHYRSVEGFKVVTWSQQGKTYALVSQEGNDTQRSCMVCHSAMGDRDLSQTPTPLRAAGRL